MSKTINATQPVVESNGTMSQVMRTWHLEAALSIPIIGSGSPEGVVNAPQFQLYIDQDGASGATQYRKILPDIGGDTTQGWKL